jgi:hypothetical protein
MNTPPQVNPTTRRPRDAIIIEPSFEPDPARCSRAILAVLGWRPAAGQQETASADEAPAVQEDERENRTRAPLG